MSTSVETDSAYKTSAKRMVIMLVLAALGAQLNNLGSITSILSSSLFTRSNDVSFINLSHYDPVAGTISQALAFLMIWGSFLFVSLYPKHGKRQFAFGFLGAVSFTIVVAISYPIVMFLHIDPFGRPMLQTGIVVALSILLLVSGRITNWMSLIGLGLGLLVGIGLCATNLYSSTYFAFSPIWLSSVFFSELFSRRLGWRATVLGVLVWVGLLALEILIMRWPTR